MIYPRTLGQSRSNGALSSFEEEEEYLLDSRYNGGTLKDSHRVKFQKAEKETNTGSKESSTEDLRHQEKLFRIKIEIETLNRIVIKVTTLSDYLAKRRLTLEAEKTVLQGSQGELEKYMLESREEQFSFDLKQRDRTQQLRRGIYDQKEIRAVLEEISKYLSPQEERTTEEQSRVKDSKASLKVSSSQILQNLKRSFSSSNQRKPHPNPLTPSHPLSPSRLPLLPPFSPSQKPLFPTSPLHKSHIPHAVSVLHKLRRQKADFNQLRAKYCL